MKAETKVALMAALLVASKACWMEFLPVAETVALKVESLAETKVALKAETKVGLMAVL